MGSRKSFLDFLNKFIPLGQDEFDELITPCVIKRNFGKKAIITQAGEVENYINFIESGLARKYYKKENEEREPRILRVFADGKRGESTAEFAEGRGGRGRRSQRKLDEGRTADGSKNMQIGCKVGVVSRLDSCPLDANTSIRARCLHAFATYLVLWLLPRRTSATTAVNLPGLEDGKTGMQIGALNCLVPASTRNC